MSDMVRRPGSLDANRRLDQWLRIRPDGFVEMRSGKVELGQGILTALAQIVARELGVRADQVRPIAASTAGSPDEGVTSGSLSIQHSGAALRQVAAEVRAIYLAEASRRLNCPAAELALRDGEMTAPTGAGTSYWALADDALLARDADGKPAEAAAAPQPAARIDLPDKAFGRPRFIHDLQLPGMLHGRMLRPPSPAARLQSLDEAPTLACPGVVAVVRDGSLVGLLAGAEAQAEQALATLRASAAWDSPADELPDQHALAAWLRTAAADAPEIWQHGSADAVPGVMLRRRFARPYLAHASIAPSCALARADGAALSVWTHSQGIYNLRRDLALAFGMDVGSVTVQHVEGAGCYGHNPADDAAFDAAWLARAAPGRPVRVQWSRADELASCPFGPAMAIDIEAGLDASGAIGSWRHTVWSNGHGTRPGRGSSPALLGAWHMDPPFERQPATNAPPSSGGGAERNAIPSYDLPHWTVTSHRVMAMPLRASALRSLGAFANVFAAEQMMDELAEQAGIDPVAFRLRHLSDPRARAVIERAAALSGWGGALPEGRGRGIGFARYKNAGGYCAVVAEIEAGAAIRAIRLTVAADIGLVVSADGAANQLEGGAIQATSWALKEAVPFGRGRVAIEGWDDYPILRFSEAPAVDVHLMPSAAPSVGAGECSVGPTAGAIANAVSAALGVRVRETPLTPERIVAAMNETEETAPCPSIC